MTNLTEMTANSIWHGARLFLSLIAFFGASAVCAQTWCNSAGSVAYCQDGDGGATMHEVGDLTYVYHADGSSAVLHRVGDVTYITDSRPGMSGVAQHLVNVIVIQRPVGVSYCYKAADLMWCVRHGLVDEPKHMTQNWNEPVDQDRRGLLD
jgi:hypothetical protein